MVRAADEFDGYERTNVYGDGTLVRISIRRTEDESYPSGWRYTLHFGSLTPGTETLEDGTIRRYDNAHEDTKGHELHVASDPEPKDIEFPGWKNSTNGSGTRYPNRGSDHRRTIVNHD